MGRPKKESGKTTNEIVREVMGQLYTYYPQFDWYKVNRELISIDTFHQFVEEISKKIDEE